MSELNQAVFEHLQSLTKDCPWDNWQHVITELRKGRIYYLSTYPKGHIREGQTKSCHFIEPGENIAHYLQR